MVYPPGFGVDTNHQVILRCLRGCGGKWDVGPQNWQQVGILSQNRWGVGLMGGGRWTPINHGRREFGRANRWEMGG